MARNVRCPRAIWPCALVVLVSLVVAGTSTAQPVNDACVNAVTIGDGATAFSTVDATTDGPVHAECEGDGQTYHDIWFTYQASCTGVLEVSTCNFASYDTDVVVYDGCDCAGLTGALAGCSDDSAGCGNFTSVVSAPAVQGNCYLIRVGGWGPGHTGTGELHVTCFDPDLVAGACCQPDDTCIQALQADCIAAGGEFAGFNVPCSSATCVDIVGADVIYSGINGIWNWGAQGGIRAYSLGSYTCNIGNDNLPWGPTSPLLAMNAFRIFDGRIEQIGMSWVKNGLSAASSEGCGFTCNGLGGSVLGAGCLDAYGANFNGGQGRLGPRSAVNAFTGQYPGQSSPQSGTIAERLQIRESDMDAANFAGAQYLVEGVYVAAADAEAGNALNNASYQLVNVSGPSYNLNTTGIFYLTTPAIYAWRDHGLGSNSADPSVEIVPVDVPGEGRFYVGHKATDLGSGLWRYDYAVYNLNSHRSASQVSIAKSPNAVATSVGFHDVDYHSGEPYSNANWISVVTDSGVQWSSPQTFAQNPNTNALRWGTLYNFWFTANAPPASGEMVITLFRPGTPASISVTVQSPQLPIGACCTGVNCAQLTLSECSLAGGTYAGEGVACSPNPCDPNECESPADCDDGDACTQDNCLNGECASAPLDSDGDGVPNCLDACPDDPNKTAPENCGCGQPESPPDGDLNGDGSTNGMDIQGFAAAVMVHSVDVDDLCPGDFNASHAVEAGDVDGFVQALTQD